MFLREFKRSLLILLISVGFSGCKTEVPIQDQGFQDIVYKPFGLNMLMDATVSSDQHLLLLGVESDKTVLVKASHDGAIFWKKEVNISYGQYSKVVSNADGHVFVFGTNEQRIEAPELNIYKFSLQGELLKSTVVQYKENDPNFKYPIYGVLFNKLLPSDEQGGFYIQADMIELYTFQRSFEPFLLHYGAGDSIDQRVDISAAIPGRSFELIHGKSGKLNMLSLEFSTFTLRFTQFDHINYMKGFLVKNFEEEIEILASQIKSVSDEQHVYTAQITSQPGAEFSDSAVFIKSDMNSGKKVARWSFPFKTKLDAYPYEVFMMDLEVGKEAVYVPVNAGNDGYVIKTDKNGNGHWVYNINGNISREEVLKVMELGDEVVVFAVGSNNRGFERTLFMLKLDKNGKIVQ